jgi:hypothetical protein
MVTLQDARYRFMVYIVTYFDASAITKDDDTTLADYILMFAYPPYPLTYEFRDNRYTGHKILDPVTVPAVDLIILVDKPTVKPIKNHDSEIIYYEETIPVHVHAIDKTGITAEKLLWKAEDQLRTIFYDYPYAAASLHVLADTKPHNITYGETEIRGFTLTKTYVRQST